MTWKQFCLYNLWPYYWNTESTIFITEDGQIGNLVLGCIFNSEQVNPSKTNRIYFNILVNAHISEIFKKKLIFHPIKLQISIFLMYWAKILAPNPISTMTWFFIMLFWISRATCRKLNWINLESVACYRTLKLRDETRRVLLRDVNDHKISLIPTKRNIEINLIFYVNLIISSDYYLTFNLIKVIYSVNFRGQIQWPYCGTSKIERE